MQTNPHHQRGPDPFAALNEAAETEAAFRDYEHVHEDSKTAGAMASHITEGHYMAFQALISGQYRENVMLISCFVNDEPGVAIVAHREHRNGMAIMPLFLAFGPGTRVTSLTGEVIFDPKEAA